MKRRITAFSHSLLERNSFWTRNANLSLYIFLAIIALPLVALIINILENFEIVVSPIFNTPPDIIFLIYFVTILIGTYTLYRIIRYYLTIRSVDYLLISLFIFGSVIGWFLLQIYQFYLLHLDVPGIAPWLSRGLNSGIVMRLLIRQTHLWGFVALFIQNVRMRRWDNYHRVIKIVIVFLLIDFILWAIGDFVLMYDVIQASTSFEGFIIQWNEALTVVFSFSTFFTQIIFPGMYWKPIYIIIIFIFLVFTYVRVKPEHQTNSIKISRIIWIFYGVTGIIIMILSVTIFSSNPHQSSLSILSNLSFAEAERIYQMFLAVTTFIPLTILLFLQVFVPDSLLITKYQIARARKLYEILLKNKKKTSILGSTRLKKYIEDIPQEFWEEIMEKKKKIETS